MHRLAALPGAFARYADIGGDLQFAVFEDADDTPDAAWAALCDVIPDCNGEALRALFPIPSIR